MQSSRENTSNVGCQALPLSRSLETEGLNPLSDSTHSEYPDAQGPAHHTSELRRSIPLLHEVDRAGWHKLERTGLAVADAGRIAITQIALDYLSDRRVDSHAAEWAGDHAHLAPNAQVIVQHHSAEARVL
jgi:hypothetical protein